MTAGPDVAPALVPRKHKSGTPRVAVPPNYVGVPLVGWTRQGERGESRGIGLAKSQPPESRKLRSRGAKSPRWSAERRASVRNGRDAERRGLTKAPLGAPSPHLEGMEKEDGGRLP